MGIMSGYHRILAGGIGNAKKPLDAITLLRETADAMEKEYAVMQEAPEDTVPYLVLNIVIDLRIGESVVWIEVVE